MLSQKKITRSANSVIRLCGERYNPHDYAYFRMEESYKRGEVEEAASWARIANDIAEILLAGPLH